MSELYGASRLYDLISGSADREGPFYTALAKEHGGRALELACGSGRVTTYLHRAGIDVTGVDLSAEMLAAARSREPELRWVEGDMRDVDLDDRFGLVFVPINSLLHLHTREDFAGFFTTVRRHLTPTGVLAFDIYAPSMAILGRDPEVRHPVITIHDPVEQAELTVEESTDYDPCTQVARTTWWFSYPGRPDAHRFTMHVRSIFPMELLSLLDANDFELVARYGDLQRGPFDGASRTQVVVARPC